MSATTTQEVASTTIEQVLQLEVRGLKEVIANRKEEIESAECRIREARSEHDSRRDALTTKIDTAKRALVDLRSVDADTSSPAHAIKKLEIQLEQLVNGFASDPIQSSDTKRLEEIREGLRDCETRLKDLMSLANLVRALRAERSENEEAGIPEPQVFQCRDEASAHLASRMTVVLFIEENGGISDGAMELPSGAIEYFSVTCTRGLRAHIVPDALDWIRRSDAYASIPVKSELAFSHPHLTARPATSRDEVRHYCRSLRQSLRLENEGHSPCVFTLSDNSLYVPIPTKTPRTKTVYDQVREGYSVKEVKRIAITYVDHSERLLAADSLVSSHVRSTYDLDETDDDLGAIGVRIRSAVEALASDDSTFDFGQGRVAETTIWNHIGPYWKAMVAAPWENRVFGTFALLKHLCKNRRETVSFWSLETKGHFAFRVRTPDHNWIRGEVFCPAAASAPVTPLSDADVQVLVGKTTKDAHVITVGSCLIAICREPSSD